MKIGDKRVIEDLIPVGAINAVAQREKIGHAALHPRKLHLWWARRPLAAARAAVYATLVPADGTAQSARSADFFTSLCKWGASDRVIAEARERVLAANGGEPPRVLDMFAGGGAIPLEAARLGCEATAVELNPVAHLIERCTLDYPQRFGPSLADDVRKYGRRWVERTWQRVGHLYPLVHQSPEEQLGFERDTPAHRAAGRPIAYLWTRTVLCPNTMRPPHHVPLVRQTWLAKRKERYVALKPRVDTANLCVAWEVVEAHDPAGLGFDPAFSSRSSTSCLACGAGLSGTYVRREADEGRMGIAPLAAAIVKPNGGGRDYLAAGEYALPSNDECAAVLSQLSIQPPDEVIPPTGNAGQATGKTFLYGLTRFRDLFTPRQLATLCAFTQGVREAYADMLAEGMEAERARAVCAYLGLALDRVVDADSTLCIWVPQGEFLAHTYRQQALPMVWDFAEVNPLAGSVGDAARYADNAADMIEALAATGRGTEVHRAPAAQLPFADNYFDAVITDPPYYDNISYADLSDFFYVWLKRSVGFVFEEHFAGELTPKRREAIVAPYRHGGDRPQARAFYEQEMAAALDEAHRVLKPGAPLVCVYAHKTTLGWSSLVEAVRQARFMITEAWPLETEVTTSLKKDTASLASSIFLVARRRDTDTLGSYHDVLAELDSVISERLERLSRAGVAGSDLVIAAIGAGLAPFTRYASVELPSGEPVGAQRFLEEVQARVLGSVLSGLGPVDPATRYYVLSRYLFQWADIEFDEANNLARTAGVELSDGLGNGPLRLADIKGKNVHLRDFTERGGDPELGRDGGPLIDVLHGLLWRASHASHQIPSYLDVARPDPEQLRRVAQALQGKALRDQGESKPPEAQACERLLGAWGRLVEDNLLRSGP